MNNPLHLINKRSEGIHQGERGKGVKKVECSLLQREPAVMSLCGGDDGGEDTLKKEQKQNRR